MYNILKSISESMKLHKIQAIKEKVEWLLNEVHQDEKKEQSLILQVHESYRKSAANLVNYLTLRSFDMRKLQRKLGYLGMSRLARAEAHVEASLDTTLFFLNNLLGEKVELPVENTISIKQSQKKLKANTALLFGEAPKNRRLRIMVTMPSAAVDDYQLVEKMVEGGMDCARINCAHDGPDQWIKMIENIKKASAKFNKKVAITMDVGGPKIRTGEIKAGPKIKLFSILTNEYGEIILPAVVKLVPEKKENDEPDNLPVPPEWLSKLSVNDMINFKDTGGVQRNLKVVEIANKEIITNCYDSFYIGTGAELEAAYGSCAVGEIPAIEQSIYLKNDDILFLYKDAIVGSPTQINKNDEVIEAAYVSCTLPEALENVKKGDPVYFDDGKIKGVIEKKLADKLKVRIIHASSGAANLKADKGINFPESGLDISGLTQKDKEDLKFIAKHGDTVNFSFVNSPQDVEDMLNELEILGVKDVLGIILKIETQRGYDNLSQILFAAMKTKKIGVMIARGDLAIEAGWKRMGSIQKEMIAICNASHVPVVWATQVLENLAKKGLPSRSEITDAVNATTAECVMLNKGPHIIEAIQLLNQLIESSEVYQDKNAPMLPRLKKISSTKHGS